jgi:hypothetical protein
VNDLTILSIDSILQAGENDMDARARVARDQKRITRMVTEKFPDYYLAGGTALAFHLGHRFSEDLDFFSPAYDPVTAVKIMRYIKAQTGYAFKLEDEVKGNKTTAGMKVFYLDMGDNIAMKVDFVEDVFGDTAVVKGGLLSIADIYQRKIFAAIGVRGKISSTGRAVTGGRQSVKDLYDLYTLSKCYKPLKDFFFRQFSLIDAQRLESWYRGFSRSEAVLELLDLDVKDDPRKVFSYMDKMILEKMVIRKK